MKPKKPYKAEDLLSSSSPDEDKNIIPGEQQHLADTIKQVVENSGNEQMETAEKQVLWQRINRQLFPVKATKNHFLWLKVAASVLIALGTAWWFLGRTTDSEKMRRVASQTDLSGIIETQLNIEGKITSIDEETANITYKSNGSTIQLNSGKTITQVVEKGKLQYNTLMVPYGKRAVLSLNDGSKVWLNSGSKLVYPAKFSDESRQVFLEGEAYFQVTHNAQKPFLVFTDDMNIKVLGTEFNVNAYPDNPSSAAVLASGSIELSSNENSLLGKTKKRLIPGNRAVYSPKSREIAINNVNIEEFTSWKDGYLLLKNTALAQLLKKLERYYRADITLDEKSMKDITFSGRLDMNEDISSVMDIICVSTSLHYTQKGRRILLTK